MKDVKDINTIQRVSIVLLGNFNPAIFHPEWFDRNQVLPPSEVRDIAKIDEDKSTDLEGLQLKLISSNVFVSGIDTKLNLPSYKIDINPEKFEASTKIKEKFEELPKFIGATFKILEHSPIKAAGLNFISSLRFKENSTDLMKNYFCGQKEKLCKNFSEEYEIDSRIKYMYGKASVKLVLETKKEENEVGINFNYHKDFNPKEGVQEVIDYVLNEFKPMIQNADEIINNLFGEPIKGEKKDVEPINA